MNAVELAGRQRRSSLQKLMQVLDRIGHLLRQLVRFWRAAHPVGLLRRSKESPGELGDWCELEVTWCSSASDNLPRGRHIASWRLSDTVISRKAVETSSSLAVEPEFNFASIRAVLEMREQLMHAAALLTHMIHV